MDEYAIYKQITDEERELIEEVKQRFKIFSQEHKLVDVSDFVTLQDRDIVRFLRARDHLPEIAAQLAWDVINWRNEMGSNTITTTQVTPELLANKVIAYGYDQADRMVVYIRTCLHFPDSCSTDIMKQFIVWMMEKGRSKLRDINPMCTLVFDMTDFGFANMDYTLTPFIMEIFTQYYPETLGCCLIVNSPWIFYGIWKIVSPWLDPNTAKKVRFVDKETMLRDYLKIDEVPVEIGGNAIIGIYTQENIDDLSCEDFWNY